VEYLTILNNSKKKDKGKRLLKKVKRATRCHAFEAARAAGAIPDFHILQVAEINPRFLLEAVSR
jgi:hypothetical protein